ncbi:MAG: ATP-binding protein, partial [Defluviitaleaceae bacterium]|nr:ATP-binding protein [Defluviitaleaceae bacterium]
GDHIAVEVVLVRLDFDGEPVLARYAKDLRQVRAMANEMKEIEIAKEENQAKTRFLTRMSHEIRTPLTQIKGIAEIELQRDSHTDQTQESFSRIYNSADLLHTIINDILDLSKVEAGKMELVPVSYELPSLIVDSVQLNLIYIEGKDVNFTVHVDEKLPTRLIGDDLRIKQIINNLLSNAFKYTHSGQVSLTFTMEKSYRFDEIILVISISDTGDGMTAEQLDMLFEVEYSRFNMSRNRAIEGSGLGMNIAHNLIELHGGEIDVHSEPGEGTTFMVRLPQRITGANPIGPEMAKNLQHAQMNARSLRRMSRIHRKPMPYGTVLVVDDVESNLYVARGLLAPYGLKVETAVSGAESVALIRAGRVYDIIFMDHMMPGMDGMLATKIIQETGYSHPIVALTANTVKGQAEIFLANGFDGFLSKPISILELDECLMKFIHAKQTPEVLEAAENAHITIEATSTNRSGLTDFFLKDAERALNILNPIIDDLAAGGRLCDAGMKSYINQTHGMKSALANMGQSWLADMASSLEDAARAGDMEAVISQTPLYLQNLRALMKELGYETARNAAPKADAAIDTESIARLLGDIASSCGEFNKRAAKTALTELQKMTLPDNISQLLTEISNLLLISSFEKAASLINTQLSLM